MSLSGVTRCNKFLLMSLNLTNTSWIGCSNIIKHNWLCFKKILHSHEYLWHCITPYSNTHSLGQSVVCARLIVVSMVASGVNGMSISLATCKFVCPLLLQYHANWWTMIEYMHVCGVILRWQYDYHHFNQFNRKQNFTLFTLHERERERETTPLTNVGMDEGKPQTTRYFASITLFNVRF